jgi:hypothetical protein
MGLLGSIFKGVVGAATGGIGGAVLGVAGDILGGMGGGGSKGASSGSASGTQTQQTQLRDWNPAEQAAYENAMAGLASAGKVPTPEEQAALRERIFNANYQPAAQAIQQGLATTQAQGYANAARRGAGSNSATVTGGKIQEARAATALGNAAQEATLAAESTAMAQEQIRQQAATNYIQQMNALWDARLKGSKVVSTNSSTSSAASSEGERSLGERILGGIGSAIGNKDSYLNTSILGKKKTTAGSLPSGGRSLPAGMY